MDPADRLLVGAVPGRTACLCPLNLIAGFPAAAAPWARIPVSGWARTISYKYAPHGSAKSINAIYLHDIQAIVVARCARFYVSTPMLAFGLVWLLSGIGVFFWPPPLAIAWGVIAFLMAAAWLTISLRFSCRCRIHTAVSHDPLPSLYRIWTAKKFLDRLEAHIVPVQGPTEAPPLDAPPAESAPALAPNPSAPRINTRAHTLASDLFAMSLLAGALLGFATVHSTAVIAFRSNSALNLLELAAAIAVLTQYYRGGIGRAMQRLAITALLLIGILFYVQTFTFTFALAAGNFAANGASVPLVLPAVSIHRIAAAVELLLGSIVAGLILRDGFRHRPDKIRA